MTGIILSLSRAMGETAPLVTIGALGFISTAPRGLGDSFTVLPVQVFNWAARPQSGFRETAAAGIIVLLAVLLTLNSFALYLRQRLRAQHRL
jgi:phosphate transport system permease protein